MSVPTEITDSYWVFHGESSIEKNDVGKWMLFYPKTKLDSKWKEFCSLWDENKLSGILSMKCSTSLKSSRSSNDNEGVIILYCNNSFNKTKIMTIGKRIIPYIQDYPSNNIYYKTNTQTRVGTIATGATTNSTYKIAVERQNINQGWMGNASSTPLSSVLSTYTSSVSTVINTSYPLPFFPDYTIDIPRSYNGGRDLSGITIRNKKGKIVKPKGKPTGSMTWVLDLCGF